MPRFKHTLPAESVRNGYDIRRTPADKKLHGLITCKTFYVVEMHFFGGRSIPCEGLDCQACKSNSPKRGQVYVSVWEANSHDHFLLELTCKAAVPIEDYYRQHGTLRGCEMKCWRPKRVKNGRVEVVTKYRDLEGIRLPKSPNVPKALCVIWRIPYDAMETSEDTLSGNAMVPDEDVFSKVNGTKLPDDMGASRITQADFTIGGVK